MVTVEDLNESRFGRSDVQSYITYLGNIISRMAENSRSCKNWLIVITSAMIAVGISMDDLIRYICVVYIWTILFMLLDCYYLGQEHRFREDQKKFVKSVREGDDLTQILYEIVDEEESKKNKEKSRNEENEKTKRVGNVRRTLCSLTSYSIWPFYLFIIVAETAFCYIVT